MAHAIHRIASTVHNRPHLITPDSLEVVLSYLDSRNSNPNFEIIGAVPMSEDGEREEYSDGLGVLKVDGTLTYKKVETLCGEVGTSYEELVEHMQEFADAGCVTVVMQVDSGGGEASHLFQTAASIRRIADENNILLIGYADTQACSAAYGLLCICDVVVANPSADIGSIGVVISLLDQSKAMEQAGYKRIFVTAGGSKVPFAEDGSFRQTFLDELQVRVDSLWDEFANHVSTYTGMSVEEIKALDAKVFPAAKAQSLGLVNDVMTIEEFASFLEAAHTERKNEGQIFP